MKTKPICPPVCAKKLLPTLNMALNRLVGLGAEDDGETDPTCEALRTLIKQLDPRPGSQKGIPKEAKP